MEFFIVIGHLAVLDTNRATKKSIDPIKLKLQVKRARTKETWILHFFPFLQKYELLLLLFLHLCLHLKGEKKLSKGLKKCGL